jgi:hypothetical protein
MELGVLVAASLATHPIQISLVNIVIPSIILFLGYNPAYQDINTTPVV